MCGNMVDIQSATAEIRRGKEDRLAATLRGSRPGVQSASLIMTSLMTSYIGNYKM